MAMSCSACGRCHRCRLCSHGCDDARFPDGAPAIRFGEEPGAAVAPGECCVGCGCRGGETHHLACFVEVCPRCERSALLECRCWLDADMPAGNPQTELAAVARFLGDPRSVPRA